MRQRIISLLVCVYCIATGYVVFAEENELDERVRAGNEFTIEYPDMGKTLAYRKATMIVYIPEDYKAGRKHPVFLWLNGGDGRPGVGRAKDFSDKKRYICVSFPLFKPNPPTPEQRKADKWGGLYVTASDTDLIWANHKIMLEDLHKLVPNIDRSLSIAGGFSNGAHTTAHLINGTNGEFTAYFSAYFFCEGGYQLYRVKELKGIPVVVSWGAESQVADKMKGLCSQTNAAKVLVTQVKMENIGHGMSDEYYPDFKKWVQVAVPTFKYRNEADLIRKCIKYKKYGYALKSIKKLRRKAEQEPALTSFCKNLMKPIEEDAKKIFEKIRKIKASSGSSKRRKIRRLREFAVKWEGTQTATEAKSLAESLSAQEK